MLNQAPQTSRHLFSSFPWTMSDCVRIIASMTTCSGRSPLLLMSQEEPKHEKEQSGIQESKPL